MDADQIVAFRLARSGLAVRAPVGLADAAACPVSDFSRDAALLALAARADGVSRETYDREVEAGELVVGHVVRGAIHAVAPGDVARYGRALIADDPRELTAQLGQQVKRLAADHGFRPGEALEEVASATTDALSDGRRLDKNELHEGLRHRVRPQLMPWCRGCKSHHVAPMLWRYATITAGARLDAERRYLLGEPGPTPAGDEAVRGFLGFYGPATAGAFAEWAGLGRPHAQRLWDAVAADLVEVRAGTTTGWLLREDLPRSSRRPRRRASASSRPAIPSCGSPTGRCWYRIPSCASACSAPSPARAPCCATAGWLVCGASGRRAGPPS
jgi:hypothetical protein